MASIVYFFSKFTTEFLLLFATLFFALVAVYLFVWVIKRRRLGVARDLIPASVVRTYLNQLIGEAQGVRTQLFGILGGQQAMDSLGLATQKSFGSEGTSLADAISAPASPGAESGGVPADLLARLQALEVQVREKESLIEGINDEKKRLQEQLVAAKSAPVAPASSGTDEASKLAEQVKALEERLEEYSVIEDDLANLKRLQTENSKLRQQLDSVQANKAAAPVAVVPANEAKEPSAVLEPEPVYQPPVANKEINTKPLVNPDDLDEMLQGNSPTPPSTTPGQTAQKDAKETQAAQAEASPAATAKPAAAAPDEESAPEKTSGPAAAVEAAVEAAPTETTAPAAAPPAEGTANNNAAFSDLDSSVDASLGGAEAAPTVPMPATSPTADESKTEAELLEEFEKLLNS
jgi:hypothetical protein